MIQIVFQDPLYISNEAIDKLSITILPAALPYFKSLDSGALTSHPLRTEIKNLPPQVILGQAVIEVSKAADGVEGLGKYSVLSNVVIQLAVSGSM